MAAPSIVFLSQSDRNTQNIYAIQCFIFLFFFLYFFLTEKAELGLVSWVFWLFSFTWRKDSQPTTTGENEKKKRVNQHNNNNNNEEIE
jgi:hypothetical protein